VLNEADPHADEAGWITVEVPGGSTMLLVEWAPAHAPIAPDLPHRTWYYAEVDEAPERDGPTRRRLSNLGYSAQRSLGDNVKAFQRDYGYSDVNGLPTAIASDLEVYHDEGRVPVRNWGTTGAPESASPADVGGGDSVEDTVGSSAASRNALVSPRSGGKGAAPSPGPSQDAQPAAGQGGTGGGVAPAPTPPAPKSKGLPALPAGSVKPSRPFPTVLEAFRANDTCGEWFRIHVVKGGVEGYFWILGDGLVWNVPDDEKWKWWKESYCPTMQAPHFGKVRNNRRLCRLPCSATQAQELANVLTTKRSDLRLIKGSDDVELSPDDGELGSQDSPLTSLLPTTLLYDQLYLQADVQIGFQAVPGLELKPPPPPQQMVNDYAQKVHVATLAAFNKSGKLTMPRGLGTPGKIWAIHPDMERNQWGTLENRPLVCAINYGFHFAPPNPTANTKQTPGTQHGNDHVNDYSQIFVAVAGYCAVRTGSSGAFQWRRTEDVYTNATFAPLIAKDGKPLPRTRYGGSPRGSVRAPGDAFQPVP
jgi:hypothetical protein